MDFKEYHIDIRKLRDYCLNQNHPVGKHKARVFSSQLGIGKAEARQLKEEMIQEMRNATIIPGIEDQFGKGFSADLSIHIKNRSALVKTIWILRTGRKTPELVTCYIIT
ncbi:DUF6883 domain-containing protein [Rhodohalobacter halophilus]|uniref:DUF6883 domain-containing protein n=1 Tax=Rhodohalobacter halophilus TaxID=1812810 RepID=UPI00083F57FD